MRRAILLILFVLYMMLLSGCVPAKKPFSDIKIGDEVAWNRDGHVIKIADHFGIMFLYDEDSKIIYMQNIENRFTLPNYETIFSGNITHYSIQNGDGLYFEVLREDHILQKFYMDFDTRTINQIQ